LPGLRHHVTSDRPTPRVKVEMGKLSAPAGFGSFPSQHAVSWMLYESSGPLLRLWKHEFTGLVRTAAALILALHESLVEVSRDRARRVLDHTGHSFVAFAPTPTGATGTAFPSPNLAFQVGEKWRRSGWKAKVVPEPSKRCTTVILSGQANSVAPSVITTKEESALCFWVSLEVATRLVWKAMAIRGRQRFRQLNNASALLCSISELIGFIGGAKSTASD